MPIYMIKKPIKFSIYSRVNSIKKTTHTKDLQALRYYNYLLVIKHHHKISSHPHAHKITRPTAQQLPALGTISGIEKSHAWSFTIPHWIVEIFTRKKVQSEIIQNTV